MYPAWWEECIPSMVGDGYTQGGYLPMYTSLYTLVYTHPGYTPPYCTPLGTPPTYTVSGVLPGTLSAACRVSEREALGSNP